MFQKLMRRHQGFTLLELLIVIVIIGILALLIVPGLISGPKRARDATRKADLRGVKNALETYYTDNNAYLTQAAAGTVGNYSSVLDDLIPDYTPSVPCDPRTNPKSITVAGGAACTSVADGANSLRYLYKTAAAGASFKLCATLENANDPDDGAGAGQDAYSVTSVNGTAPAGLCSA